MQISVHDIPNANASVAFVPSPLAFREDNRILPRKAGDFDYIPWGADNLLPYGMIDRFEADETLQSCMDVQAENVYAAGLSYILREDAGPVPPLVSDQVEEFSVDNDFPDYFLGVCRDIKMFEFAVSVLILSNDGSRIVGIFRKHAAYCRFAPADASGHIPYILYANWRENSSPLEVERIDVVDSRFFLHSLKSLADAGVRKVAVISRLPGYDSLYYPIPSYGSIFRGKWWNIKNYIAVAKEAKLKNSAPLKYLIEISQTYWDRLYLDEHIVETSKKLLRQAAVKKEMVDFLTGAENSGKAIFSNFFTGPDGKESHDIRITKIDSATEGGDWASDHAEAINMICFAMRVHSNLVGSVPGKAQSNNSGSDKRELYVIAQTMQKAYRQCLLRPHRMIIRFNGWRGYEPYCPVIQLTTLDQHKDAAVSDL